MTLAACKAVSDDTAAMDVDGQDQPTGLSDSEVELRDQLYELADVTLQAYSEHILFLERYYRKTFGTTLQETHVVILIPSRPSPIGSIVFHNHPRITLPLPRLLLSMKRPSPGRYSLWVCLLPFQIIYTP